MTEDVNIDLEAKHIAMESVVGPFTFYIKVGSGFHWDLCVGQV